MPNGRETSKAKLKTLKAKQRQPKLTVPIGQDVPVAALAAPSAPIKHLHASGMAGAVALGLMLAWLFAGCAAVTCGARGSWLLVGAIFAGVVAVVILVADWIIGRRAERGLS